MRDLTGNPRPIDAARSDRPSILTANWAFRSLVTLTVLTMLLLAGWTAAQAAVIDDAVDGPPYGAGLVDHLAPDAPTGSSCGRRGPVDHLEEEDSEIVRRKAVRARRRIQEIKAASDGTTYPDHLHNPGSRSR